MMVKHTNDEFLKSPIVDSTDSRFLYNMLERFKYDKIGITKRAASPDKYCLIIKLPDFPKGADMYTGMEPNRPYNLVSLGLVKPKPISQFEPGTIVKVTDPTACLNKFSMWFEETGHNYLKQAYRPGDAGDVPSIDRDYIVIASTKDNFATLLIEDKPLETVITAIKDVEGQVYLINDEALKSI